MKIIGESATASYWSMDNPFVPQGINIDTSEGLKQFESYDDAITFLFMTGEKDLARQLHKQTK